MTSINGWCGVLVGRRVRCSDSNPCRSVADFLRFWRTFRERRRGWLVLGGVADAGMPAAFFVLAAGAAPAGCVAWWWPWDEFGRGAAGTVGGVPGACRAGGWVTAGGVAPALECVEVDG